MQPRRSLFLFFAVCISGVLLLASCAKDTPLPPPAPSLEPEAKKVVPAKPRPKRKKPVERLQAPESPQVIEKPAQKEVPAPKPKEAEPSAKAVDPSLSVLVSAGVVEQESPGRLAFAARGTPATDNPGLYEDAIILSGVRARLKALTGVPEGMADSARVAAGEVTLTIPSGAPAPPAASAVDAALLVPGVRRVVVEMPAPVE